MKKTSLTFCRQTLLWLLLFFSTAVKPAELHTCNNLGSTELQQQVVNFQEPFSNEGIMLHVANRVTSLNTIFFKAYLLKDDSPKAIPSQELRLEVLNDSEEKLITQRHKIKAGVVEGAIQIPKKIVSGAYRLRVYTPLMLKRPYDSFVEQIIYITDPRTKQIAYQDSLQVSIEGGSLIAGMKNRIVVFHPNPTKQMVPPTGKVLDDTGSIVANFQMFSNQIGTALLDPVQGSSYSVQFGDGLKLSLPEVQPEGYVLQVNNLASKEAIAQIMRTSKELNDSLWLTGNIGGKTFFRQKIEWTENQATVKIDKSLLPSGILKLRLLDDTDQTHAYRPVFHQDEDFDVWYEKVWKPGGQEGLKITTLVSGKPKASTIALSVTRNTKGKEVSPEFSPKARLIQEDQEDQEDREYIAESRSRAESFVLDLYALVEHASSDNRQATSIKARTAKDILEGINVFAYVYDLNNNLLDNTTIQIYAKTQEGASVIEVESDREGRIALTNLDFTGIAEFTFRTKGADTKSRLVKAILIDREDDFSMLNPTQAEENLIDEKYPVAQKNNEESRIEDMVTNPEEFQSDTQGLIKLDEATVVERRNQSKVKTVKSIYGIEILGKRVKYQDPKKPKTFAQLLVEIPGVFVRNIGGTDDQVNIPRVNGQVMWVIDGYMLPQDFDGNILGYPRNSLGPVQDFLNPQDIERIDLLLGPDASIFGSRGTAGVFSITTRSGSASQYTNRKEASLFVKGYEPEADFDSFWVGLSRKERQRSNLLYWNPSFQTDEDGHGLLELPTDRQSGKNLQMRYLRSID